MCLENTAGSSRRHKLFWKVREKLRTEFPRHRCAGHKQIGIWIRCRHHPAGQKGAATGAQSPEQNQRVDQPTPDSGPPTLTFNSQRAADWAGLDFRFATWELNQAVAAMERAENLMVHLVLEHLRCQWHFKKQPNMKNHLQNMKSACAPPSGMSRREFLRNTALATAAAPFLVSCQSARPRVISANEKLQIGRAHV